MDVDWDKLVLGPTINIFGSQVQYVSQKGGPIWITGVFDEAYLGINPALGRGGPDTGGFVIGDPGPITTEHPVLGVRLAQFPYPPQQSDVLRIASGIHSGETYQVREVQPDGHGGAKLTLNAYES